MPTDGGIGSAGRGLQIFKHGKSHGDRAESTQKEQVNIVLNSRQVKGRMCQLICFSAVNPSELGFKIKPTLVLKSGVKGGIVWGCGKLKFT